MRYGVFDNGVPASEIGIPRLKGLGWTDHVWDTLTAAQAYAHEWLGACDNPQYLFEVGVPVEYSGYGDFIEIKEVE